jgi:hypothetical protein
MTIITITDNYGDNVEVRTLHGWVYVDAHENDKHVELSLTPDQARKLANALINLSVKAEE